MHKLFSKELMGQLKTPREFANVNDGYGARMRRYRATIEMDGRDIPDGIVIARVPAGSLFMYALVTVGMPFEYFSIGTEEEPDIFSGGTRNISGADERATNVIGPKAVSVEKLKLTEGTTDIILFKDDKLLGAAGDPNPPLVIIDLVFSGA